MSTKPVLLASCSRQLMMHLLIVGWLAQLATSAPSTTVPPPAASVQTPSTAPLCPIPGRKDDYGQGRYCLFRNGTLLLNSSYLVPSLQDGCVKLFTIAMATGTTAEIDFRMMAVRNVQKIGYIEYDAATDVCNLPTKSFLRQLPSMVPRLGYSIPLLVSLEDKDDDGIGDSLFCAGIRKQDERSPRAYVCVRLVDAATVPTSASTVIATSGGAPVASTDVSSTAKPIATNTLAAAVTEATKKADGTHPRPTTVSPSEKGSTPVEANAPVDNMSNVTIEMPTLEPRPKVSTNVIFILIATCLILVIVASAPGILRLLSPFFILREWQAYWSPHKNKETTANHRNGHPDLRAAIPCIPRPQTSERETGEEYKASTVHQRGIPSDALPAGAGASAAVLLATSGEHRAVAVPSEEERETDNPARKVDRSYTESWV